MHADVAANVRGLSWQVRDLMVDVAQLGGYRIDEDGMVTSADGQVVTLSYAYQTTLANALDALCIPPSTPPQS